MSYYRTQYSPQVGLGGRITPGVKALLIINVGVFALQVLAQQIAGSGDFENTFGLLPNLVIHKFQLWRLVTYMFLHSTSWLSHLLLNMLMLWMFGTEVERVWGTREFVKYYFVCGISGANSAGGCDGAASASCVPRTISIPSTDRWRRALPGRQSPPGAASC